MVANTIELPLKSLIVSAEEDFSKVTINPESQSCLKEKKKKAIGSQETVWFGARSSSHSL